MLNKYWRLNFLQIKSSKSASYFWVYVLMSFLCSFLYLNFSVGINSRNISELSIATNMSDYYIWFFKILILIYLTLQYCAFIEADLTSGSMFHRYLLGFTQREQCFLIILYMLLFTISYHILGVFFVTVKLISLGKIGLFFYAQQYGLLRLPNECIRVLIVCFLTTYIYLRTRKSTLTFFILFLIWLFESIIIILDKYWYSYGLYKFLPLHTILSYDFLTEPLSLKTIVILAYAALFSWLFYRSIQKTKETIILNHFI